MIKDEKYGIKELFIGDDELNTNPKWLLSICNEIIKRKVKIAWKGQMRVNEFLTPKKLFPALYKAGCWHIAWGIESGVDQVLVGINKKITVNQIKRALTLSKKFGIKNMGLFMVGNIWKDKNGVIGFGNVQYPEMKKISHVRADQSWEKVTN